MLSARNKSQNANLYAHTEVFHQEISMKSKRSLVNVKKMFFTDKTNDFTGEKRAARQICEINRKPQ